MLNDSTSESEVVIACDPNAIPVETRERWIEIGMQVYAAIEEVRELPDGYACRLPSDAASLRNVAEYVSLDRLCGPFVRWVLILEPNGGYLWLHMTGVEGVKAFLRQVLETTTLLNEQVAGAAGFDVTARTSWVHPNDPDLNFN